MKSGDSSGGTGSEVGGLATPSVKSAPKNNLEAVKIK